MIDFSLIKIIPADESYYEFFFQLKKAAMGPYVEKIWGWDDKHQRERLAEEWLQESDLQIIMYHGQPIGSILLKREDNDLHLGRFYLMPEYQNKGIGTHILEGLLEKADKSGQKVMLGVLRINPAIALYKRYGFNVTGSNEHQYLMERKPGGKAVHYKAVIFDLFGTLVDKLSLQEHRKVLIRMASIISAYPDDFIKLWFATFNERGLGVFQGINENVKYICRKLELSMEEEKIEHAVQINIDYTSRAMKLRPYAYEVLAYLKAHACKIGLISDCGAEIPKIYNNMPLASLIDESVFSCSVGVQKPDPRIYQTILERLAVKPKDCLYIGDGDSNELSGALQIGMQSVLIRNLEENRDDVYRTDFEGESWQGPVITSLKQVLDLL